MIARTRVLENLGGGFPWKPDYLQSSARSQGSAERSRRVLFDIQQTLSKLLSNSSARDISDRPLIDGLHLRDRGHRHLRLDRQPRPQRASSDASLCAHHFCSSGRLGHGSRHMGEHLADSTISFGRGGKARHTAARPRPVAPPPINVCMGNGGGDNCLGPGVVSYSCDAYNAIGGGAEQTYVALNQRFCNGKPATAKTNVRHNFSHTGGQCGWTSFTVTCLQ
jgi:hypothetical protein